MKKLIIILFYIIVSCSTFGQPTSGTRVTSSIVPNDSGDVYPTHDEFFGRGGYRTVSLLTDRDAIKTNYRKEGMLVKVIETDTIYQLKGGINNSNWVAVSFSQWVSSGSDISYSAGNVNVSSLDVGSLTIGGGPLDYNNLLGVNPGQIITNRSTVAFSANCTLANGYGFNGQGGFAGAYFIGNSFGLLAANFTTTGINYGAMFSTTSTNARTLKLATTSGSGDSIIFLASGSQIKQYVGGVLKFAVDNGGGVNIPTAKTYNINGSPHTHTFSSLTSIPTTLSGYGITDAVPNTRTVNSKALSANITLTNTDIGSEPALGNPATNGFVLSSTTAGVRSWIAASGVTPVNNILNWFSTGSYYRPFLTKTNGTFYRGTTAPSDIDSTLNYDGVYWASAFKSTGNFNIFPGIQMTNNGATGISYFTDVNAAGTGYYANNNSTGLGASIINVSTGIGISVSNQSTGTGLRIDESSTGNALTVTNGATNILTISSGGDVEIFSSSNGIILHSPNNSRWRIQVTNAGALTVTGI